MYDYAPIAATAKRLIDRFGKSVTLSRPTGTYNPDTGKFSTSSPTTWTATAVQTPNYKGVKFEGMDEAFKEALIKGKATTFLVASTGLTNPPVPGDSISAGSKAWRVIGVTELNPGGTSVIFFIGAIA